MDALKVLKEHENEIKKRFGVKRIGIFGSHAQGEEKETSDVDVLVEFVEPSFDNFMDLAFSSKTSSEGRWTSSPPEV